MPRTKGGRSSRAGKPVILQDRTGLAQDITTTIIGEFVTPLEVRIEQLEAAVAGLSSGVLHTATVALRRRRSGTLMLEGTFAEEEIGAPVLVTQAAPARIDEAEFGLVLFVGQVVSRRKLRLAWFSLASAPAQAKIVYIIGRA